MESGVESPSVPRLVHVKIAAGVRPAPACHRDPPIELAGTAQRHGKTEILEASRSQA